MTFSAMNTNDFHTLLTAPIVSRAAFFAYYLGTASDLAETPGVEPLPTLPAPEAALAATEPVRAETN